MPKAPKTKKQDTNKTILFPVLKQKNFLELTEVEPDQIYVINKFFTEKECQSVTAFFETNLPPKESPGGKPKKGYAFRNNDRQALEDPKIAQLLWQGMEQIVLNSPMAQWNRTPKGLNSNIRVYRYRKGHSFASHYDESVQDKTTGLWTDWTLLIYLNDDMEGGETVFYKDSTANNRKPDPIIIKPKKGMALFHRHGTHCLLHEAMEVVNGNKWVLRSDVLIG